jgi:hypothetical protein
MGNVLDLSNRGEWSAGVAVCLECHHRWAATAPAGTYCNLECPACGLHRGVFDRGFGPSADQPHCVCLVCGCNLFFIRTDGVRCFCCGQLIEIPVHEIMSTPESPATPEIDADILPFTSLPFKS